MLTRWLPGDVPVTQAYGCTDYLAEGPSPSHPECPAFHDGIDLGAACGTPVTCPVPATCVQVGVYGGGPNALILDLGGWWVWLLHLDVAYVGVGQTVPVGSVVGLVGSQGFSTGCHLHFEVTRAGGGYRDSVDPGGWLTGSGPLPAGVASSPSSWPLPLEGADMTPEQEAKLDYAITLCQQLVNLLCNGTQEMAPGVTYTTELHQLAPAIQTAGKGTASSAVDPTTVAAAIVAALGAKLSR